MDEQDLEPAVIRKIDEFFEKWDMMERGEIPGRKERAVFIPIQYSGDLVWKGPTW